MGGDRPLYKNKYRIPSKTPKCRNGCPNPFRRLWRVLNRRQPNGLMKCVIHRANRCGKHGFMIGLSGMKGNFWRFNNILI
jgi:hypothetical protein